MRSGHSRQIKSLTENMVNNHCYTIIQLKVKKKKENNQPKRNSNAIIQTEVTSCVQDYCWRNNKREFDIRID